MSNYIPVPRDLTKVKSKVLFGLTKRQLICFSIAAAVGIPAFFLLRKIGPPSAAAMGMMVLMMPMFFLGMYEKNGQPLEVLIIHFIQARFIRPKVRIYQANNYYSALKRQAQAEREVMKIVSKYTDKAASKKAAGRVSAAGRHFTDRQKTH